MSAQKPKSIPIATMVSNEDLNAYIRSHTSLEPSNSSSGTSTLKYNKSAFGIHIIDEGEKDKNGKVILASKEPCGTCGGKVVWATMGEFLIVFQGVGAAVGCEMRRKGVRVGCKQGYGYAQEFTAEGVMSSRSSKGPGDDSPLTS